MKIRWLFCVMCTLMLWLFTGCSNQITRVETDEELRQSDEMDEETLGENADLYEAVEQENKKKTGETAISEDGFYQISIPSGWNLCEDKLNDTMLFEIQGATEDQYMGILVLPDEAYGEFDIAAYMDAYEDNMRHQYEHAIISEKTKEDINGNPAYYLTVTGTVNEIEYINHIYAVDYEEEKVIFTASTYEEHEDVLIEDLKEVVYSFGKVSSDAAE